MNNTLASARHQCLRPAMTAARAPYRYSLTALLSRIAAWRERTHFRWELKRMAKDNPHLIDDIGLTRWQVEEEIAKLPFWQR
ncbi:DUF1127 domain-containing protein [Mesorhizobium sp. B1-1-8]|uniref:DUF1127 domain-containing protein n=1 Tax=Mesorhizobium sp. B1-1-8 TaxID=2589976 RepID=UPI0011291196|nr:DUF1127 domain-containing protein [Mesorhizobium sp. B1-1-8]UCI08875.1 DUF1127 domain-containing protein [Mesorhizobium sp. B1-1-8]